MGDPSGLIVVGVDGSAGGTAALEFALAEGLRRGSTVEVVTAWLGGGHAEGASPEADDLADGRARIQLMQDETVARSLEQYAAPPEVLRVVVHDYAGRVLVSRAERASMVVVGSGSPGSASQQVLGSVAEYCVRHARVPVVIVPAPARLERRAAAAGASVG